MSHGGGGGVGHKELTLLAVAGIIVLYLGLWLMGKLAGEVPEYSEEGR